MFTLVVMLPSALWGNAGGAITISLKVLLSVVALRLLIENEQWESILRALRVFFIPRLFILVLDITTRYLVLLGEHSLQMLYALKVRSVGRNAGKTASLAGIAGMLFLKSRQMAEETYAAMECRCFTGAYPAGRAARLSAVDLIPLALDALTVFVFFAVRAA
jgi:cobalt/nickel transport system permease protein